METEQEIENEDKNITKSVRVHLLLIFISGWMN